MKISITLLKAISVSPKNTTEKEGIAAKVAAVIVLMGMIKKREKLKINN
jgi:hypothetical protein